jgi:hypothetical protein
MRKGIVDLVFSLLALAFVGIIIYFAWLYYNHPEAYKQLTSSILNATKNALGG